MNSNYRPEGGKAVVLAILLIPFMLVEMLFRLILGLIRGVLWREK